MEWNYPTLLYRLVTAAGNEKLAAMLNFPPTKVLCSRDYICSLEAEVDSLERELRHMQFIRHSGSAGQVDESRRGPEEGNLSNASPDDTRIPQARPAIDSLDPKPDGYYLGVSSGMHLARSVLQSARLNDPLIDHDALDHRRARTDPASQESAPSAIGDVGPTLPSEEVALSLIDIFLDQYQLQYPIVSEEWLVQETREFYRQQPSLNMPLPKDTCTAFILQMILSISLLTISKSNEDEDALTLAESLYSSAMSDLTKVMEHKGLETLQCLLLLVLYSLLHFSATPIWHISGLSMRMCIDLGLHSEGTIKASRDGKASDAEIDCKRRLFWATYTLDRTLSIMLGRPFTLEDKYIDVAYPELSLPDDKRKGTVHWIKLQRLQSIAVSRSHVASDQQPRSQSTDTKDLADELEAWNQEASVVTNTSRYNSDWWRYWYHNTLLILHRPSPNSTSLNMDYLSTCYTAAKNVIEGSFIRLHTDRLDVTCVDIHYQFMAGITLLFLVWNSGEVRQQAIKEWTLFKSCLVQWELVLEKMATRWDRANRAKEVVHKLSTATVDIVEREMAQTSNIQTTMHRDGRTIRAREQERVRFIMQQLRSPRLGRPGASQTAAPRAGSTMPGAAGVQEALGDVGGPTHSHNSHPGNDPYEERNYHQHEQTYNYPEPVPTSSLPDDAMIVDDTSLYTQIQSYQEAEFAHISQMLRGAFDAPVISFPSDLSAMFGDSLWSSTLGASDDTYLAGHTDASGLFSGSGSENILGDAWLDNAGRATNMAWADSVLNFAEDWEIN
ncbi:fungal-specific transcription factor domain-containing protein [Aspergillus carlsbadensis]|nr:fungal-specific transcription factor domain-containing protein [Aspergillus carlsbadensis]